MKHIYPNDCCIKDPKKLFFLKQVKIAPIGAIFPCFKKKKKIKKKEKLRQKAQF